jgi:hypothetical protein
LDFGLGIEKPKIQKFLTNLLRRMEKMVGGGGLSQAKNGD